MPYMSAIYCWALIGYNNSDVEGVLVIMTQLLYYAHNICYQDTEPILYNLHLDQQHVCTILCPYMPELAQYQPEIKLL